MAPDIRIEIMVRPFISAYKRMYATNTIQRIMINAICVCESFFLAIYSLVNTRKGRKKGTDSHLHLFKDP